MSGKKLLILGATGNIGQWLLKLALEQGHQVTALVRSKQKIEQRENLTIIEGNPMDAAQLDRIMSGHDAVLSCLGIRRENQADPWSPVISPSNLTENCATNVVNSMKQQGVQRMIAISAAGVGDSRADSAPEIMNIVDTSNIAISFRDLEKMEAVLAQSGLDTLALRPVTLIEGGPSDRARKVETYEATSQISKGSVAAQMLEALDQPEAFERKTEMIGFT